MRREAVAQVGGSEAAVGPGARRAECVGAVVELVGADAREQADLACDLAVRAPGGGHGGRARIGRAPHLEHRLGERVPVLHVRPEEQGPVDVEEQEHGLNEPYSQAK